MGFLLLELLSNIARRLEAWGYEEHKAAYAA